MGMRWILAAGACLALALLTLPAVRSLNVGAPAEAPEIAAPVAETAGAEAGSAAAGAAECDDDARPAPLDFTLADMNGDELHLASLKGQVILLNFWATWCGPCKIEIPAFIELQDEYGDQGFQVLGLSVDDTPEQMRPFAEELDVNYPMLVGLDRDDFQDAYGPIWGLPVTFWIDREGTLCKTHMGIASKDELELALKTLL
ncbi:MAG: TlpA disulfide reductase family protein [Acidobacteria bacterium]|nr:TlpA disulfide reductase family protein [Acidobacteriota bacterium]